MNTCIETKLTLSGEAKEYRCELLSLRSGAGILRYVIEQHYDVAGFLLAPGDETLAVYWEDRPYTLYIWKREQQGDRAWYFNIADSVSLLPAKFIWRDLAVDILVRQDGKIEVLDEHELPADLAPELLAYIGKAKTEILGRFRDIIEEAERLISVVC